MQSNRVLHNFAQKIHSSRAIFHQYTSFSSTSSPLSVLSTISDVRKFRDTCWRNGATVGLVPTMGALHDGHLDLVRSARKECDHVIVSVFVNPTQFLPHEDFNRYPRDLKGDMEKLSKVLTESNNSSNSNDNRRLYVFAPTTSDMYPFEPAPHATFVNIDGIDDKAEGRIRPGHMRGVATVVSKLFNICQPQTAYFGQKDGLQCIVIKRLIRELNFPVKMQIVPTRREADGLAMSSRNVYLSADERKAAPVVYRAMSAGEKLFAQNGERKSNTIKQAIQQIISTEPIAQTQYISVADSATGTEIADNAQCPSEVMISLAVKFGNTRLIDNCIAIGK